jgi:hypothetical protein
VNRYFESRLYVKQHSDIQFVSKNKKFQQNPDKKFASNKNIIPKIPDGKNPVKLNTTLQPSN